MEFTHSADRHMSDTLQSETVSVNGVAHWVIKFGHQLPCMFSAISSSGPNPDCIYEMCLLTDAELDPIPPDKIHRFVREPTGNFIKIPPDMLKNWNVQRYHTVSYLGKVDSALDVRTATITNLSQMPKPHKFKGGLSIERKAELSFTPGKLETIVEMPAYSTAENKNRSDLRRCCHIFGNLLHHIIIKRKDFNPYDGWNLLHEPFYFNKRSKDELRGMLKMFAMIFFGGKKENMNALNMSPLPAPNDDLANSYIAYILGPEPKKPLQPAGPNTTPLPAAAAAAASSASSAASAVASSAASTLPPRPQTQTSLPSEDIDGIRAEDFPDLS